MQSKRPRFNPLILALALAAVLMVWSVLGGTHGGTLTLRDNIPNGSVFSFALPQSEVNIHE